MKASGSQDFRTTFPAALAAMEAVAVSVRERLGGFGLSPGDAFAAELLLREALSNAVIHGSHTDETRHVRCAVRIKPDRLLIVVRNEGEGFDWRSVRGRKAAESAISGRGLALFDEYADRVRFNRSGTRITLLKRLSLPTNGENK